MHVDQVHIDLEVRRRAIAAHSGVHAVEVETPRAIGGREAGQERAVEALVERFTPDLDRCHPTPLRSSREIERAFHLDRGIGRHHTKIG